MPAPSTAACFGVSISLVSFLALPFAILIVEEDTDQRTSLIGMRQRTKLYFLPDLQRFTTKTRGGFNGFHCHRFITVSPAVCATMPLAMVKLIATSILLSFNGSSSRRRLASKSRSPVMASA